MCVYIICAMFNDNVMYVVGNGDIGFKSEDSAKEYLNNINKDWVATHYIIKNMKII